jgi:hypothetical protein
MLLVKRAKRFHELYFFTEASQLRGRRPGKKERRKDTSFFGRNRVRPVVTLRESSEVEEFHRRVAVVDVGVDGDPIWAQHISHPRPLDAKFRA